jgi:hypothetical protein
MLKEQKTACEEDSKKNNYVAQILSLEEKNNTIRKEIDKLKAENEELKLEFTTNTAATLLKMKSDIAVMDKSKSPTQNTTSSSNVGVKDSSDSSSSDSDSDPDNNDNCASTVDKNAVLEFKGEIKFDFDDIWTDLYTLPGERVTDTAPQ